MSVKMENFVNICQEKSEDGDASYSDEDIVVLHYRTGI
jgi:hypothetical protein